MEPTVLNREDFLEWSAETLVLYARDLFRGKAKKFNVSVNGEFTITYGDEVIYCGNDLNIAINSFNYIDHTMNNQGE